MEVWFNPSCSKCRSARDHLEDAGVEYTLRRYLDDPPSEAELRPVLTALGLGPWDITRMSEPLARELGLQNMARDTDAWIRLLAEHPILIQRPLVLTDEVPGVSAWRSGSTRRAPGAAPPGTSSRTRACSTRCAATSTTRRARRNCGAALTALGLAPWDITRMSDPLAHEFRAEGHGEDADMWIRMLAEHPKLIQAPSSSPTTDVRGSPGTTRR